MADPFLILALPRSRTAWLSTLMTWGPSLCYHDGLGMDTTAHSLPDRLQHGPARFCGDADTLLARFPRVLERLGPVPTIVVRRPLGDIFDSIGRWRGFAPDRGLTALLEAQAAALEELGKAPHARIVNFSDLDDPELLDGLWAHLTRHQVEPPPRARTEQLLRLDIQVPHATTMAMPLAREAKRRAFLGI